jgi:hypothetical protein
MGCFCKRMGSKIGVFCKNRVKIGWGFVREWGQNWVGFCKRLGSKGFVRQENGIKIRWGL